MKKEREGGGDENTKAIVWYVSFERKSWVRGEIEKKSKTADKIGKS
jgi:hypothetical protein